MVFMGVVAAYFFVNREAISVMACYEIFEKILSL